MSKDCLQSFLQIACALWSTAPKTVKINLCLRQHASTCLTGNENNAIMTNAYCGASRTSLPTNLCKHFHKSQFNALRGSREEQAPPLQVSAKIAVGRFPFIITDRGGIFNVKSAIFRKFNTFFQHNHQTVTKAR